MSALESLEAANFRLKDLHILMHLSEVKGPVTDRLDHTHFLHELTGSAFVSQYDAIKTLVPSKCEKDDALLLAK